MNMTIDSRLHTSSVFIEKKRLDAILKLALPIIVAMFGFSSIGLIDIAMVGQLGDVALASLGVANALFFLLFVILMGLGTGLQTLTAMRVGEGKIHLSGYDLNAGLLVGAVMGGLLMILGYLVLPFFMSLMNKDPEVVEQGIAYLNTRLPQLFFFSLCFSFRSYWNGISQSKLLLLEMVLAIVANVFFNYLLIYGNLGFPKMGTAGAGLSTTIANFCTLLVYFIFGMKLARKHGFLKGLPGKERVQKLLQLTIPVSISRFLLTLSIGMMYWIAGLLGTKELAAFNVINNIAVTILLSTDALGFAAITFVGQALGGKDSKDAKNWGWDIAKLGSGSMLVVGIIIAIFPRAILSMFIVDIDTIDVAVNALRISGLSMWLIGFSTIIATALIGAGAAKTSLVYNLAIQWCLALPLQWLLGVYLGYGLAGITLSFLFAYVLGVVIIALIWQRQRWAPISV